MAQEITQSQVKSSKLRDYAQLMKFRLSSLVVFSAMTAFVMASDQVDWIKLALLTLGGFLVTGSSNAFNQIIEKDFDKLMVRTGNRPLPQERMTYKEAIIFSSLIGILGIAILWFFMNPMSGILGIVAMVLYVVVYTPLKRLTPFAVFAGAFPGSIPPMLGWVAATNDLGEQALILFTIQFFWQFPHFWSLAWVLDDDYKKAGFRLLPAADGRSKTTALQIAIYSGVLIPLGFLPYMFNMAGSVSAILILLCAIYLLFRSLMLLKTCEIKEARKVLYASFLYLPVVQLALMFDKTVNSLP